MKKGTVNKRRAFLGSIAAGAVTMGMMTIPDPLKASPLLKNEPADDLEAWFSELKGKHKMVFDSPHPNGIVPFAWPRVFLMTNEKTGTPINETNVVVVLRHYSIPYALTDKLWEKYNLGEFFKADDPLTQKPATRNPLNKPKHGDFSIPGIGAVQIGINELQEAGVKFCVCEMAMTVNSAILAAKIKKDAAEVRTDWTDGLLPGIKLVPSGVWAIGRAQEHGSAYCFAG